MPKAVWNGKTIVESDDIAHVEGNAYFRIEDVDPAILSKSADTRPTYCHWKGIAQYFDVTIDGETNIGGAWYYPEPYPQAEAIRGRLAFWNGVEVTGAPEGRGLVEGEPTLDGKTGWEALCWLIKFSEDEVISMEEITKVTGITADQMEEAWGVYDVQRYSTRYKRKLAGSAAEGWRLERVD